MVGSNIGLTWQSAFANRLREVAERPVDEALNSLAAQPRAPRTLEQERRPDLLKRPILSGALLSPEASQANPPHQRTRMIEDARLAFTALDDEEETPHATSNPRTTSRQVNEADLLPLQERPSSTLPHPQPGGLPPSTVSNARGDDAPLAQQARSKEGAAQPRFIGPSADALVTKPNPPGPPTHPAVIWTALALGLVAMLLLSRLF
jgi:hypothetical protein